MKTLSLTKPRLPQSVIFAGLIMMFSLISACDNSTETDLDDPALEDNLGTLVGGSSNFPSWPIIDEDNGKWYYFDDFHKTLERFDEKTMQREIMLTADYLTYFRPTKVVDSLLFGAASQEGSTYDYIFKFNTNTKKGTLIIEDASNARIDESGKIFFNDRENEIYVSDFNGNKSKLGVQGQLVGYSNTNNKLIIREQLPARVFIYNLDSKLTEPLTLERSGSEYSYYWNNNEIIQVSVLMHYPGIGEEQNKLITITNLSKNEVIKKYDDYWGYQLLPGNKIALVTEVKNEKSTRQQLTLGVYDYATNKSYDSIATSSNGGYFIDFHLYKNGEKIVYWVFPFYTYFSNDIK